MRWKAYERYKDSGIEWLGEVPEHWDTVPVKRVFRIINGSTPRSGEGTYWDGNILWATPDDLGSLGGDTLYSTRRTITEEGYTSCGVGMVPQGGLILSTRAPIGHVAVAGVPMCTNQGCKALALHACQHESKFYYYVLVSSRDELNSWGQGSTFRELSRDSLSRLGLVSPPPRDQRAIVAFLDRQAAHIDALIEKKRRQIELLQEKRTALISHAVTKGLDPNAKMKDSGIEWLGEVPISWRVTRLKRLGSIRYGLGEPPSLKEDGVPFIRATDIERGKINPDRIQCVDPSDIPWSRAVQLEPGDILVVRSGAYTGDSAIVSPQWAGSIAGYDMVFRPLESIAPGFLAYVMLSRYVLQGQIYLAKMRAAQPHLNAEELGGCVLSLPPTNEQRAIAAFLDRETARIDALAEKVRLSIDTLKEYRTALISAAVTGKIDVRQEVVS